MLPSGGRSFPAVRPRFRPPPVRAADQPRAARGTAPSPDRFLRSTTQGTEVTAVAAMLPRAAGVMLHALSLPPLVYNCIMKMSIKNSSQVNCCIPFTSKLLYYKPYSFNRQEVSIVLHLNRWLRDRVNDVYHCYTH